MIRGIYAEDADKLNPEQWVNVYYLMLCDKAIFHSSCQVKELNLDNPEDYGLELTDEYGNLMSVKQASNNM